jgi:hypothetical protein
MNVEYITSLEEARQWGSLSHCRVLGWIIVVGQGSIQPINLRSYTPR